MTLDFKTIDDLDYNAYLELTEICYPHINLTRSLFDWHLNQYPPGKKRNFTIFDGKSLVGIFSAMTINFKYNEYQKTGSLLTNAMIHPKYRGKNNLVKLLNFAINKEKSIGMDSIFVVPSNVAFRSVTMSGFKVLGNLDFIGKFSFKKTKHKCININSFDSNFDVFKQEMCKKTNFMLCKDSAYLNWRYVKRPDKNYKIFIKLEDDEIAGWIVMSQYDEKKYLKTHIVDLGACNFNTFKELIKCAENFAVNRHELNCWQIDHSKYYDWFMKENFITTAEKNILMMLNLKKNISAPNPVNWWFPLGDNDVY